MAPPLARTHARTPACMHAGRGPRFGTRKDKNETVHSITHACKDNAHIHPSKGKQKQTRVSGRANNFFTHVARTEPAYKMTAHAWFPYPEQLQGHETGPTGTHREKQAPAGDEQSFVLDDS